MRTKAGQVLLLQSTVMLVRIALPVWTQADVMTHSVDRRLFGTTIALTFRPLNDFLCGQGVLFPRALGAKRRRRHPGLHDGGALGVLWLSFTRSG